MFILLTRRNGLAALGSGVVRLGAGGPMSHCDLYAIDPKTPAHTAVRIARNHCGRVIGATALHGVESVTLAVRLAAASRACLVHIPRGDGARAIAFCEAQIGKRYDYWGALGVGARRDWESPNAWSCGELLAAASHASGDGVFNPDSFGRIGPDHFWMLNYPRYWIKGDVV